MMYPDHGHYRSGKGYWVGNATDFNMELALNEVRFWDFLEKTQATEVDKLRKDPQYKLKVTQRLDRLNTEERHLACPTQRAGCG